jgi:surface antigen
VRLVSKNERTTGREAQEMCMKVWKPTARRAALTLLIALPCITLAAPPDWAPAHGWRKKHDPNYPGYSGYSGRTWDDDYGVRSGSCNRDDIGAVLGGVAGGVIGSQVGKETGSNRTIATVVGTVIGATIGHEIGRRMDRTDRSCVGQALELAAAGQDVKWTNPNTRVTYQLTPLPETERDDGCRQFRLIAHGSFGLSEGRSVACPDAQGVWTPGPNTRVSSR